jgi:hypothetical protein
MKRGLATALGFLLLLFAIWILSSSSSLNTCKANQTAAQSEQAKENPPEFTLAIIDSATMYARCIGHVGYEYRDAITAVATAFIALFTLTLWWSTKAMMKATKRSVELAREEFIATHRPKIKIHAVEITRRPVNEDNRIGASILCFNVGESAAKNVEVRGEIFAGPRFAIDVQRPVVKTIPEVLSGQKLRAEINSDWRVVDVAAGRRQGIYFYCIGWIAYWDESGHRRETGFCLRAEFSDDGDRWASAGKPEYEYDY